MKNEKLHKIYGKNKPSAWDKINIIFKIFLQ
jgi:hypothetical protein